MSSWVSHLHAKPRSSTVLGMNELPANPMADARVVHGPNATPAGSTASTADAGRLWLCPACPAGLVPGRRGAPCASQLSRASCSADQHPDDHVAEGVGPRQARRSGARSRGRAERCDRRGAPQPPCLRGLSRFLVSRPASRPRRAAMRRLRWSSDRQRPAPVDGILAAVQDRRPDPGADPAREPGRGHPRSSHLVLALGSTTSAARLRGHASPHAGAEPGRSRRWRHPGPRTRIGDQPLTQCLTPTGDLVPRWPRSRGGVTCRRQPRALYRRPARSAPPPAMEVRSAAPLSRPPPRRGPARAARPRRASPGQVGAAHGDAGPVTALAGERTQRPRNRAVAQPGSRATGQPNPLEPAAAPEGG